jgi:hypothetical protein
MDFDSNTSSGADSLLMRLSGLDSKSTDRYTVSSASQDGLSLIYTALPRIIQRRLPQIRSLRHAASVYASPKAHLRSWSTSSATSTYSESPPPSYHTGTSTSSDSSAGEDEDDDSDDEHPEIFTSAPSSRPSTSGSVTPAAFKRHEDITEPSTSSRSGHHGLALLNLAMRSQPTPATNDPLNRRLYIDGISYILRGLPSDLTPEETLVLRSAIPVSLMPEPQSETAIQQPTHQPQQSTEPPTLLHRTISTATFYTLLLLTLMIPYMQSLFTALYALDARHNFSARFLTQTAFLLRLLAAQAVAVLAMAWGANDGALRHACRDFGVWVLRDVCGGMDEGVGRAVVGLRLERESKR